jgi:hypothetical protein
MRPFEDKSEYDYLKSQLKQNYIKVYENLSKQVSIKSPYLDNTEIENQKHDPVLIKVANIIETNYGISKNIILEDYELELKRRNVLNDDLVPTFYTRFAMEEGSWNLFLRHELPEMLNNRFQKIVDLENRIWIEQIADPEEGIYYLLEMEAIGKSHLKAIFDIWMEDHNTRDYTLTMEYILPALLNIFTSKSEQVIEGSLRILTSKMNDLETAKISHNEAEWRSHALEYIKSLKFDLEYSSGRYKNEDTVFAIALQGYLQSLMRKYKKSSKPNYKSKTKDILHTTQETFISLWDDLPVEPTEEETNTFTSNLYSILLSYQGIKPLEAVNELIKVIPKTSNHHFEKFKKIIDEAIKLESDPSYSYDYNVALMVNEKLPTFLLELKRNFGTNTFTENSIEDENNNKTEDELENIMDLIEIGLKRLKRLDDNTQIKSQVMKLIESSLNQVVNLDLDLQEGSVKLLEGVSNGLKLNNEEKQIRIDSLNDFYIELTKSTPKLRFKEIQKELIEYFTELIVAKISEN